MFLTANKNALTTYAQVVASKLTKNWSNFGQILHFNLCLIAYMKIVRYTKKLKRQIGIMSNNFFSPILARATFQNCLRFKNVYGLFSHSSKMTYC